MTGIDIARLRALAEAATPGPWALTDNELHGSPSDGWPTIIGAYIDSDDAPKLDVPGGDAAYLEAVHPGVVLALVEAVQAAQAVVALKTGLTPHYEAPEWSALRAALAPFAAGDTAA